MPTDRTYKKAGLEDLPVIRLLARRIWEEAYNQLLSKEQIEYMLGMMYSEKVIAGEILNSVIWEIIFSNDEPCGYISYASAEDNSVKLSKIYIEKGVRGKGLAEDSLKRVLDYAIRNKKRCVFLTVNKGNKRAIRAYEKSGFIISDAVVTDIGNGFVMDDYIMQKVIFQSGTGCD